ncbi:hypothetical protein AO459_02045 [Oenococcus oeni]|uniref:hypothetical protein n=1 Tax=Oenococcus oeni TaxID=1247 RepID=UPI000BDF056C|nr:hypothetical protein [Oenococcus oeni]PDH81787.1 hypothetical protein AO459_02045 [Oenococcus oeni]PDH83456.1 hypothetical protein AO460_01130 [Oenococcus oeni]
MNIIGIILAGADLLLGSFLLTQQKKLLLWEAKRYPEVKKMTLYNGLILLVLGIITIAGIFLGNRITLLICAILSMIFAWSFLYQLYKLMNSSQQKNGN